MRINGICSGILLLIQWLFLIFPYNYHVGLEDPVGQRSLQRDETVSTKERRDTRGEIERLGRQTLGMPKP